MLNVSSAVARERPVERMLLKHIGILFFFPMLVGYDIDC